MKLSLLLIYEQLNRKDIILKMEAEPGPYFSGVRTLPQKPPLAWEPDILYVDLGGYADHFLRQELNDLSLISVCCPHMEAIRNGIFVERGEDLQHLFNNVLDIFQRFQDWNALTQEMLLEGKPFQEIFNLCAMVTPDTVYLTDSSMKMYVHSVPTLLDDISAIWRYQASYGYMPIHIINRLMTNGELERINRHRKAFTLDTKTFNNPYTCRNIFSGRVLKAHIFIVSIYSKPSQTHKEIAERLGVIFTPYICQNPAFSSRAGQIFENFFLDLLKRRVQDQILIRQQISIFGWDMGDIFSILVIDGRGQSQDKQQFLINYFCGLEHDCQAFENEGHIICLLHVGSDKSKKMFSEEVDSLLRKLDLQGAFSKNFSGICNMDIYYAQAASILRFCGGNGSGKHLFLQEDVGLYGILEASLERHDALELCHPDVLFLYEYDQKNGTEYMETLLQYLLNDRNAVKAAKALYIHRNTMNYRLERLRELLCYDEEDNGSRLFVLISILLLRQQMEEKIIPPVPS